MMNPNYARQLQEKIIIKLSQLPIVQQQQILELVESFAPHRLEGYILQILILRIYRTHFFYLK